MSDAGRLALGTAQWGLDYGVANRTGRATRAAVDEILTLAAAAAVDTLDTARAYGIAEEVVGAQTGAGWRVVTKLAPDVAGPAVSPAEAANRAAASLHASRAALRRERLDAVLLHRPEHLHSSGRAAWDVLRDERDRGAIGAIGVSVVGVEAAAAVLDDPDVAIIQVPASLLDRRLHTAGFFGRAEGREIFVRSAFLQGVAHLPLDELPAHLAELRPVLAALDRIASVAGAGRAELFLAWVRRRLTAARVVIGAETATQLRASLDAWSRDDLDEAVDRAEEVVPELPEAILDPWRWPR